MGGDCPPVGEVPDNTFCTVGMAAKTMLDKGKWCSTAEDCTNSYVQYDVAGYGTGYYECVSNGKTCGPEKTEEGMTVWKFCSDVCLATSGTSKLPMGGCDAGPLTEPRYTSKTACESY